jgi:hypothetical protein
VDIFRKRGTSEILCLGDDFVRNILRMVDKTATDGFSANLWDRKVIKSVTGTCVSVGEIGRDVNTFGK